MHGVLASLACARDGSRVQPRRRSGVIAGTLVTGMAALIAVTGAHSAPAPFRVIGKAGDWEAFAGILAGKKVCGMSTKGNGRWLNIRYTENDTKVVVQLGKDSWKVQEGISAQASMQIDNHTTLTSPATLVHTDEGGVGLQFSITSKSVLKFTQEFMAGTALAVRLPKDTQLEDWQADLSESQKIAQTWAGCLSAIDNDPE